MKKGDWVKYVRKTDGVERWHELMGGMRPNKTFHSVRRYASDGVPCPETDTNPPGTSLNHANDAWTREIIPADKVPDYVWVGIAERALTS